MRHKKPAVNNASIKLCQQKNRFSSESAVRTVDTFQQEMEVSMKKKIFIILTSVMVLSLAMVGIVNAYQGPTLLLDEPAEEEEDNDELICSYEKTHPVLKRLAENYAVEYEDLVDYFCHDYEIGVGEIKHALKTAEILDDEAITYETLLDMFIGGMDWGEIWKEFGLIGFGDDEDEMDEDNGDMDMSLICSGEMDHPVLLSLAESYEVEYSELVTYFCEGYGVGEIKLALETAEKTEDEDLWSEFLDMRNKGDEEMGWGEIWQELGLIGKDKEKDNEPGSENKGKPENHPGKGKGLDKKP
jgi:hypothetical protein